MNEKLSMGVYGPKDHFLNPCRSFKNKKKKLKKQERVIALCTEMISITSRLIVPETIEGPFHLFKMV